MASAVLVKKWGRRHTVYRHKRQILKGSVVGVKRSGLPGFWTLFNVRYYKEHNVSKAGSISVLR
jgi:hypothetical protein